MRVLHRLCREILLVLLLTPLLYSCSQNNWQSGLDGVDAHLTALAEQGEFSGIVLIASAGETLFEEAYGFSDREQEIPLTSDARMPLHMLTMQFTAAAILKLQEAGALSVQDPICNFISNCPDYWRTVTIHHLLSQTSGVSDYVQPWGIDSDQPANSGELVGHISVDEPYFPPGEGFRYSHNGYIILGHVIEMASGQPYERFLQTQFFEPLGMLDTGLGDERVPLGYNEGLPPITHLDPVYRYSSSGLISTTADLSIWIQALMHGEVLADDSLEALFTGYAATPSMDFPGSLYGYGWFIGELHGHPSYFHGGMDQGYTAFILYFPEEDLTLIVLRNYGIDIYDRLEIDLAEMVIQLHLLPYAA